MEKSYELEGKAMKKKLSIKVLASIMLSMIIFFSPFASNHFVQSDGKMIMEHSKKSVEYDYKVLPKVIPRFETVSGLHFDYPNAVKGIYVTGQSVGGKNFPELLKLVDNSDLNAMVIDVKDDAGHITYMPEKTSRYYSIGRNYIKDPKKLLKQLETKKIYPIARIVVFKDTVLAKKRPDWSFKKGRKIWTNRSGDAFVNPFLQEVWDYNIGIAIEAAKLGFQEIQFDYVRFPEGFEKLDKTLTFSRGKYVNSKLDDVQRRVQAVTDFVKYAKEKLEPFHVKVSVDIFGYTATLPEAPGIGQNFSKIAEEVDVISSMIYPSHWTSYFGIKKPDKEPYRLVKEYVRVEKRKLQALKSPPITRPWLQDFTATYLGRGNYRVYGKNEVEAQIRALNEEGIYEFLLWNASNQYTKNVDYTPLN